MNPPNLLLHEITEMLCGHIMYVLVKVWSFMARACLAKACRTPAPESCCGQQGKVPQTAEGGEQGRPALGRRLPGAAARAAVLPCPLPDTGRAMGNPSQRHELTPVQSPASTGAPDPESSGPNLLWHKPGCCLRAGREGGWQWGKRHLRGTQDRC